MLVERAAPEDKVGKLVKDLGYRLPVELLTMYLCFYGTISDLPTEELVGLGVKELRDLRVAIQSHTWSDAPRRKSRERGTGFYPTWICWTRGSVMPLAEAHGANKTESTDSNKGTHGHH